MPPSFICAACRRALLLPARPPAHLLATRRRPPAPSPRRLYSSSSSSSSPPSSSTTTTTPEPPSMSEAEAAIARLLVDALAPSALLVQDVSGGCGSMYAIDIAAEAFRGHPVLRQQRMVNKALGDRVRAWHGVQIRTAVPDAPPS